LRAAAGSESQPYHEFIEPQARRYNKAAPGNWSGFLFCIWVGRWRPSASAFFQSGRCSNAKYWGGAAAPPYLGRRSREETGEEEIR
jgi:hypothetical protein